MKYFIGVVPPSNDRVLLDDLRKRFAPRLSRHIEAHITIVPPMEYPDPYVLTEILQKASEQLLPCRIRLSNPNYFGKKVLYLSVEEEDSGLTLLHKWLVKEVNQRRTSENLSIPTEERPFHPHLTLAMASFGTPYAVMEDMRLQADQISLEFASFEVNFLRAYVREKNGWQVLRDYDLKGTAK